jgi:hypothetical protein
MKKRHVFTFEDEDEDEDRNKGLTPRTLETFFSDFSDEEEFLSPESQAYARSVEHEEDVHDALVATFLLEKSAGESLVDRNERDSDSELQNIIDGLETMSCDGEEFSSPESQAYGRSVEREEDGNARIVPFLVEEAV